MSKVYPRHGSRTGGAGGGERIRPGAQQQQHQRYARSAPGGGQQQRSAGQDDFSFFENISLFTILCSIPVIFILWHYFTKMMSKLIWGSLQISVEVSGPRLDHPNSLNDDSIYRWLLEWLARNLKNLQNASVMLNKKNGRLVRYPGFGMTNFQYKGTWIRMDRAAITEIKNDEGIPYEKITLSFVSSRSNRTLLYELLEECRPNSRRKKLEEGGERMVIYEVDPKAPTCWKTVASKGKKRRHLSTVILEEDLKEKLVADLKEFLERKEWYTERGIPYRRNYLLYGPSGCGKTSLANGIAGEYGYDICSLALTSDNVTDDTLPHLVNSAPDNCILLIEDVDFIMDSIGGGTGTGGPRGRFGVGGKEEGNSSCKVTLSGLLNAIDGIRSPSEDGRIIIMTASQVEKLDPALTRPGRVDLKFFLTYPSDDQLRAIFSRYYPEAGVKLKGEFVKRVRELGVTVTMAQIQGLFLICNRKDNTGLDAMDRIADYFEEQFTVAELEPNK